MSVTELVAPAAAAAAAPIRGGGVPAQTVPEPIVRGPLPGVLRTGFSRGVAEVRVFFRNRTAVVMNMALPVALMLLFGQIFKMKVAHGSIPMHDVVVAGVLASGMMSAGFGAMATGIAMESGDGTQKRLRGTPFTTTAYFLAKAVLILTLALIQTVIVLALAVAVFHFSPPTAPGRWFTFAWVFVLGSVATAFLGIAVGSLVTDRRSISGVVQFPFVVLQFISGVYYSFTGLPQTVQYVGAFFPLKWMAQGMRAALLPDSMASYEAAHSWELGRTALVLSAWVVGGFALCVAARLRSRRDLR